MSNGYINGKADPEWWMHEVRRGISFRRKSAMEHRWETWRSYYRGKWAKSILPVNLFFRMIRMTVPRVYFRNPSISIVATKPGVEQMALGQLVERVDNKLIRTMRMKQSLKTMVQHAFLMGTAVGKLGYGSQYAMKPEDMGHTTVGTSKKNPRERIEYHSYIRDDMPWFAPVHPSNFIVPQNTTRHEEARWSAVWTKRSVDDVKVDPRLKHGADLKPGRGQTILGDVKPKGMLEEEDMVDLLEIRDTKMQRAIILAPYASNKVLYEGDDTMQTGGRMPNYVLVFNEDDENMWGVPDSVILEPQQLELNEIRTLQMKHRRLTIMKLLYKKNTIKPDQLQKLLDGDVMAGVEVEGELSDIDSIQVADIPQSLFAAGNEVINDVRENMGFSRNQAGNYAEGSADRTATEAQIVNEAAEIRVDERRDMVADIIVDIMTDTNKIVFDQWNDEIVDLVMGPNALPVWVAFKPAMLKAAEYTLNIDPDSSLPETKAAREQKAIALFERLRPNPLINPELLTKFLLHELQGTHWDHMMQVAQMALPGQAGGSPDQPMDAQQYMSEMMVGAGGQ